MKKKIKPGWLFILFLLFSSLGLKAQLPSQRPLSSLIPESVKERLNEKKRDSVLRPARQQLPSENRRFLDVAAREKIRASGRAVGPSDREKEKMLPSNSRGFLAGRIKRSSK